MRIRACVIRRGIELISVRGDRTGTVICIVFDVGVDLNRRSGLHLTAVTVVGLCRDRNRTGLLRRSAAGRCSGVLERHDIGRLSARNAERNTRCHRIRYQRRNRGCSAVHRNLKIGDGNLRCRIETGIYIFLAVEIAVGIDDQIRRHAIGLSIKRRVDRRSAVLILQHELLVRAESRGICLNNPVAVVRHQNFIGTVRSAVDQEVSVRCRVQLYLRIGRRIIHAEANVLQKCIASRIVGRVSVCLIPDKTADFHILQDIAKRKAGLPRRAEVRRRTAAHVKVTEDHILVLHTSEESLWIVKLVLHIDKGLLTRIHIVDLHANHRDIRLVRRNACRVVRCLCSRVTAGRRIRIRRIRNGVIQTRKRRSIDAVIIQFVLIDRSLVRRTAARIAIALSLFHDRDIELPVTRVLRVIACNVYLGAEDVVVRAYISARDLGRRLIERNRGLRVGKQTQNCLLVNLVKGCCIRIQHLGFSCCRRNLCGALVKEVRADRSVIHELVSAVCKFNRNALRVSALSPVAVRIEIRVHPDTHDRLHIDRIRIVFCLQFEQDAVITAVQRRSVVGFQLNFARCKVFLRHILIGNR